MCCMSVSHEFETSLIDAPFGARGVLKRKTSPWDCPSTPGVDPQCNSGGARATFTVGKILLGSTCEADTF